MARGFESKSVQEQWQDAEAAQDMKKKPKKTPEQMEKDKKREGLELSRRRIVRELEAAKSEARCAQLRAALAHLDQELGKIGS
jgi:hypothetical protein